LLLAIFLAFSIAFPTGEKVLSAQILINFSNSCLLIAYLWRDCFLTFSLTSGQLGG